MNLIHSSTARCTKCREIKPLELFSKHKRKLNGRRSSCKVCETADCMAWRERNADKFLATNKRWRDAFASAYHKKWRAENAETVSGYGKKWRAAHPDKVLDNNRKSDARRSQKLSFRLSRAMSNAIRKTLHSGKGGRSWELIVGYTHEDLMNRLEGMFLPGMSWGNKRDWHIDHIIPKSAFKFSSYNDAEFKECWSLENLQPLWAEQNLKKKNKILKVDINV